MKPGTRCECRNADCGSELPHSRDHSLGQCSRDAVRMVTVLHRGAEGTAAAGMPTGYLQKVPLCAACADWAEKGAAK